MKHNPNIAATILYNKFGDSPANLLNSTNVLMVTPHEVSNPEPLDSLPCVLTTMLLGGYHHHYDQQAKENISSNASMGLGLFWFKVR